MIWIAKYDEVFVGVWSQLGYPNPVLTRIWAFGHCWSTGFSQGQAYWWFGTANFCIEQWCNLRVSIEGDARVPQIMLCRSLCNGHKGMCFEFFAFLFLPFSGRTCSSLYVSLWVLFLDSWWKYLIYFSRNKRFQGPFFNFVCPKTAMGEWGEHVLPFMFHYEFCF